jgi:hypothetical protein
MLTSLVVIEVNHPESLIYVIGIILPAMPLPSHGGMVDILRSLGVFIVPIPSPKRLVVLSTQFLANAVGGTPGNSKEIDPIHKAINLTILHRPCAHL